MWFLLGVCSFSLFVEGDGVKLFESCRVSEMSCSVPEMSCSVSEGELSAGFERIRNVLSSSGLLTPESKQNWLDVVVEAEKKMPFIFSCSELGPEEHFRYLRMAVPDADANILLNLSAMMKASPKKASCKWSSSSQDMSSSSSFITSQERGLQMMAPPVDLELPHALEEARADEIWPKDLWLTDESPAISMKQMIAKLQFQGCTFDLVDKGRCESVCGKGSKPDMVLKLKGHSAAVYCTGALICLHSGGVRSRFDNLESLSSKAEDYGKRFLRLAGPSRKFIIVGVTELQNIAWYKIYHDGCVGRSVPTTTKVKQTLCAFLIANPDSLDVNMSGAELQMPKGWKWITTLGWGKTSVVHEFEHDHQSYAVKVARGDFKLHLDFAFLTLLNSVDGVPKIRHQLGNMLAIQPVGVYFTKANIQVYGLNYSLSQLIDILQMAHAKGFVNRDVRTENFMIATSMGTHRFYIIDWGFACEIGTRSLLAGSLYTASDNVLEQVQAGTETGVVFETADDLVALIRCIWMFYCEGLSTAVKEMLGTSSIDKHALQLLSFWKEQMAINRSWQLWHIDMPLKATLIA